MNNDEIQDLKERLANLETLDKNNDGVISKQELELWKREQNINLEEFRQKVIEQESFKHQKELLNKEAQIKELEKQIRSLKALNDVLQIQSSHHQDQKQDQQDQQDHDQPDQVQQYQTQVEYLNDDDLESDHQSISSKHAQELSEEQIRKFVEELLADENVNIAYLPDWVERQLYINFFNLLIGLLKKTINTTSIKFIGHNVTLDMTPCKK